MKFDIARQPLVPAFLTLLLLTVVMLWGAGEPLHASPENTAAGTIAETAPIPGLQLRMPATLLHLFQTAHPALTRWIGALLILLGGLSITRLALRANLYTVSTCLALPLYGVGIAAAGLRGDFLTNLTACTLLVLALRNYCRSFGNGYRFDALFRASLYLGTLLLLRASLLPLLLLLPLAVLIFRRTLREAAVACAGLLLPAAAICYVNWGCGGDFIAPLRALAPSICNGVPLALLPRLTAPDEIPHTILTALTALLALFATLHIRAEYLSVGIKPRFILIFIAILLLLLILSLGGPDATPADRMLLAVPTAILIPFSCVRIHRNLADLLCVLLFTAAVTISILQ